MGLIRVILELLVFYLVYKLIFDFIIPVYRTTKQVNKQMGDIQSKMNEHMQQPQSDRFSSDNNEPTSKPSKEDYIEFEEVK